MELEIVERISNETVRHTLKNDVKPWLKTCWCIPPKANADFFAAMEDVLKVYSRDFDDETVLVCMDETSNSRRRRHGHRRRCGPDNRPASNLSASAKALPTCQWSMRRCSPGVFSRSLTTTPNTILPDPSGTYPTYTSPTGNRAREGQPQHPQSFDVRRDVRPDSGFAPCRPFRGLPHAEALKLAENRRNRY